MIILQAVFFAYEENLFPLCCCIRAKMVECGSIKTGGGHGHVRHCWTVPERPQP